ncbi:hypothetical protein GYMLUDRAFT_36186 [Collybiopsis luxurians FD-317 M1]|nr:hypothetical protein GYMLUDRAFT_36186 [Collybiopsis luxurians FD-317 M1]
MLLAEGAPARDYLILIMQKPSSYCAMALLVLSIAVEVVTLSRSESRPSNQTPGLTGTPVPTNPFLRTNPAQFQVALAAAVITLFTLLYLCYVIYTAVGFYVQFYLHSLRTDYKDPVAYYELRPAIGNVEEDPEFEPTGKKGFWAAEIVSPTTGKLEIVGTITLDDPPAEFETDPKIAELRRMFVSPKYRQRGIAAALIRVCEAHAMASKLSAVILRTTVYQPAARKLYSKFGYKIWLEKEVPWGLESLQGYLYKKEMLPASQA